MTSIAIHSGTAQHHGGSRPAAAGLLPARTLPPASVRQRVAIADLIADDPNLFDDVEQGVRAGLTKLEDFIASHRIKPAHLARMSGYSRQHLLRVRKGRMDPTGRCMVAVTLACRVLARKKVSPFELFDFGLDPRRVQAAPARKPRGRRRRIYPAAPPSGAVSSSPNHETE